MTTTKELNELIERARLHGADVLVLWDEAYRRETGGQAHKEIAVRSLPGIGPNAMSPISAAEALRSYFHTHLLVKAISPDGWGRPRLENLENGRVYADITLGHFEQSRKRFPDCHPIAWNIAGDWHTTSGEGEPDCRLRPDITFVLRAQ